ncbi:hypothetical protein J3F83DRAFT_644657 [Trichoderma novae-zelandiae]
MAAVLPQFFFPFLFPAATAAMLPSGVSTPSFESFPFSFFFLTCCRGCDEVHATTIPSPRPPSNLDSHKVHVPGATHTRPALRTLSYVAHLYPYFCTSTCINAMEHNIECRKRRQTPSRPPSALHRRGAYQYEVRYLMKKVHAPVCTEDRNWPRCAVHRIN